MGARQRVIGFGASAHLAIQVARSWGCETYVFTRSEAHRRLARELGALWAGGAEDDWDVGDVYEIDMDQVATVKFKVTPSPGAVPFSLASANTVVSFNDANNNQNATYLATLPVGGGADPFAAANTVYWTHTWLVGNGPAIDTGDVVEFTVAIKNLTKPLTTNAGFSVEVVPQSGSALAVSRTTPLEMALVMDLN